MLILAALLSLIVIICGFFLLYTVYFRFLKLLIIVPIGSIAYSTMVGASLFNFSYHLIYDGIVKGYIYIKLYSVVSISLKYGVKSGVWEKSGVILKKSA